MKKCIQEQIVSFWLNNHEFNLYITRSLSFSLIAIQTDATLIKRINRSIFYLFLELVKMQIIFLSKDNNKNIFDIIVFLRKSKTCCFTYSCEF